MLLAWTLYRQIIRQPDLELRWSQVSESWATGGFWLVVFLMFFNWGLESFKWKILVAPLEKFPFFKAVRSVLAGCSITMLTPNRIGEYGGRIMYVQSGHRLKAISLTILGSTSQLIVTMFMGSIGLLVLRNTPGNAFIEAFPWLVQPVSVVVSFLVTVILLFLYFRVHEFIALISRISLLKGIIKYINVVDIFTGKQLLRILFLSFLRYMVFILQYALLLHVMQVHIEFVLLVWLLTVFYLLMVLLPTMGFIELPVRAITSVKLMAVYSSNILGIQAAAFGIWIINLVIPAIVGSLLIFGLKIMKER